MTTKDHTKDLSITEIGYWDAYHQASTEYIPTDFSSYKNFCSQQIFNEIKRAYNGGGVVEVGAGSSNWLIEISKALSPERCVGLDYSEAGCRSLAAKASQSRQSIEIAHADMFSPPDSMTGQFDFVISFGVVEHFKDLDKALVAISRLAKPGGVVFTLIPNMAGLCGTLTKFWDKKVYDMHVPHDLASFLKGHEKANLEILSAKYLGTTNFGVLSSCFCKRSGANFWLYKQLTRLSKVLWFVESKGLKLPTSKLFSPYIVVVSRVSI